MKTIILSVTFIGLFFLAANSHAWDARGLPETDDEFEEWVLKLSFRLIDEKHKKGGDLKEVKDILNPIELEFWNNTKEKRVALAQNRKDEIEGLKRADTARVREALDAMCVKVSCTKYNVLYDIVIDPFSKWGSRTYIKNLALELLNKDIEGRQLHNELLSVLEIFADIAKHDKELLIMTYETYMQLNSL